MEIMGGLGLCYGAAQHCLNRPSPVPKTRSRGLDGGGPTEPTCSAASEGKAVVLEASARLPQRVLSIPGDSVLGHCLTNLGTGE